MNHTCLIFFLLQLEGYSMPVDKAATIERLYRFCGQCQALEPHKAEYALSTRLCLAFRDYVTELGVKVVEDRRAEVCLLVHWDGKVYSHACSSAVAAALIYALIFIRRNGKLECR